MNDDALLFDDFYAPPIEEVRGETDGVAAVAATGPVYTFFATDRDVEFLAAGVVTADMQAMATSLLSWKRRYWDGMSPMAADGAYELYLELLSYGLDVG